MDTNNDPEVTTLLLVDDDPDDQELFKLALTEIKQAVCCITACNGQDALEQLTTQECYPDLIFLDMNMPLMNGLTFLGKIKEIEALKRIPVIIYSTTNEPREMDAAKTMGAIDFITKPTKFADLCQVLHHMLRLHVNA
jgi:CheY-like chemotaxis protein